jgi:hypothetical protein
MREYRLHYKYERIGVRAVQATSAAEASGKAIDRVRDFVPVTGYRFSLSPTRSTRRAARLDNDRLRQVHHRNGRAIATK